MLGIFRGADKGRRANEARRASRIAEAQRRDAARTIAATNALIQAAARTR